MSRIGMSADDGRALDDIDHIRQSVRRIITTPLGSRVMRRDYGSLVPELIDQPGHAVTRLRVMAATVIAIARWESRISITGVDTRLDAGGRLTIAMDAVRRTGPRAAQPINFGVPL